MSRNTSRSSAASSGESFPRQGVSLWSFSRCSSSDAWGRLIGMALLGEFIGTRALAMGVEAEEGLCSGLQHEEPRREPPTRLRESAPATPSEGSFWYYCTSRL